MLEVPSSVRSRLGVCLGLLRVKSRPMPFEPPTPWESRARQGFHYGMDRVLLRHVSIRIHGRWKQRLNLEDFVAEGNTVDHKERHPSSGHSLLWWYKEGVWQSAESETRDDWSLALECSKFFLANKQ